MIPINNSLGLALVVLPNDMQDPSRWVEVLVNRQVDGAVPRMDVDVRITAAVSAGRFINFLGFEIGSSARRAASHARQQRHPLDER